MAKNSRRLCLSAEECHVLLNLRYSLGVQPTIFRNSRLKLEIFLNPHINAISVIGVSVWERSSHAFFIRRWHKYSIALMPAAA